MTQTAEPNRMTVMTYDVTVAELNVGDTFIARRDLVARVVERPRWFCDEWLVRWESVGVDNRRGEMHFRSCPSTVVTVISAVPFAV